MGKQHGLGVLHMGTPGHDSVLCLFGLADKGLDDVKELSGDEAGVAAQPHADEGCDLVVAGTAGAEFAAEFVTGDVEQAAFECGGFIFIFFDGGESTVVD